MKAAIITGASSGLGREFVRQISKWKDIDEIWVVARRKDRLEELALVSDKHIRPLALDLSEKSAFDVLRHQLEEHSPNVKILVNAAGLGKIAMTKDLTVEENDQMIDVNCRAAVNMTLTALPYMKKGARLINVCSVAGFLPLTGMNTYAASKAFLLSWTKALHYELLSSGIRVTALCPYWVKDTEFIPVAMETGKNTVKKFPLAMRTKAVVTEGLLANKVNFWVSSPGGMAKLLRVLTRSFPDAVNVPVWDILRRL